MLKRLLLTGIFLFFTGISAKEYSCGEIMEIAFENSEELQKIKLDREKAESMKKEYFGMGLPKVEASINYQFVPEQYVPYDMGSSDVSILDYVNYLSSDDPSNFTQPWYKNDTAIVGALDGIINILSEEREHTIAMELSITQPLFAKGNIYTGLKIAKEYLSNIDLQIEDEKFKIAKDVKSAYNSALLATQNATLQAEALKLAEESFRLSKARFSSGKGTVLDTLNAQYSLQKMRFSKREAEKNRKLAVQNLLNIASINEKNENITLSGELEDRSFTVTYEMAEEILEEKSLVMKQLGKAQTIQSLQTKIARNEYFPTLYAGASFARLTQFHDDPLWGNNYKYFVGATVPIFSGAQRLQKMRQSKIEEKKLIETKDGAFSGLKLGLLNYYEDLEVAKTSIKEVSDLIKLAEQAFRVSKVAFEAGQITQKEYLDSEQNRNMAKLAYNNALYQLNSSIDNIKYLLADKTLITEK